MNQPPNPSQAPLALSLVEYVDKVCDRFEEAWPRDKGGPRPRIEDYLGNLPEPGRSELLRELLRLELAYRRDEGERPGPEEYLQRFPQHRELVLGLFRPEAVSEAGNASSPSTSGQEGPATVSPFQSRDPGQPEKKFPQVPGYEILGELGRGGMGVVYQARQVKANRLVALKMILAGDQAGEAEFDRFRTEVKALAPLGHPHIVQVHEVGEHAGQPFFSMEFCPGGSLDKKLDHRPLPPGEAAALVGQLAGAMHAAHRRGVIHRDLKPANVLLTADGTPKVTDFGLAKKLDEAGKTQSGAVLGTPSYMAPEQAQGRSKELGPACDVYALGAVLYECLTGRPPFKAATPLDTLMQVVTEEPVPPGRLNPGVPPDLETICLKCLAKEPARRYADAEALAEDLRRFLAREPIAARPVGRAERLVLWARRRPAQAALVGLGLLVLVLGSLGGAAAWLWWEASEARDLLAREKKLTEDALQREAVAKGQAEEAFRREQVAKGYVARARDDLNQVLYLRRVTLAYAEWRNNEVVRAKQLLRECPSELQHWEWGFVHNLCYPKPLILNGHKSWVTGVCFSPDGRRLASASEDRTVKVWDAVTCKEALTLEGHADKVTGVCFSPDGQRLASASLDKTVRVWDATTGRGVFTLRGHSGPVLSVCYSPDGQRLASSSQDGMVRLWDAATGKEVRTLQGHTHPVTCVCFSPDGQRLASASRNGTIRVWDFATGQKNHTLRVHSSSFLSICFSPDGKRLASPSHDGKVKVWDLATGQEARTLRHAGVVNSVCFSPNGQRLVAGSWGGAVRVWDLIKGKEIFNLDGFALSFCPVCFSPDSQRLATTFGTNVLVWDLATELESRSLQMHTGYVNSIAFSPDSQRLATADREGKVRVWDATTGRGVFTLRGHSGPVLSVCFSPDGRRLASASADRTVRIWDAATGRGVLILKGHVGGVTGVCFSPDGRRLASASEDRMVKVWNAATGKVFLSLEGHADKVTGVSFSPDGQRLASASLDKTVRVWDATTGRGVFTLRGHSGPVLSVCYSPDGQRLASASADRTVKMWDANTGYKTLTLGGHIDHVTGVCFSPDGRRLASASDDETVRIWEAGRGEEVLTLKGNFNSVTVVCFSPDGRRLASASQDKTVRIWDALLSQKKAIPEIPKVLVLFHPNNTVINGSACPDGHHFISVSDRQLCCWEVDNELEKWKTPNNPKSTDPKQATVTVSPDGKYALSGGFDGMLRLIDIQTGKLLKQFTGHRHVVWSVAFSPDGKLALSGSEDATVRLWDVESGKELHCFCGHAPTVGKVGFLSGGRVAFSASWDRTVRFWDLKMLKEVRRLEGIEMPLAVAMCADGKRFFSGGRNIGHLLNAPDGEEIRRYNGHVGDIWCADISRDQRLILTGSEDRTVRLWDLETGKQLACYWGHTDRVTSVCFSPDGKLGFSTSKDGSVRVWKLTEGNPREGERKQKT